MKKRQILKNLKQQPAAAPKASLQEAWDIIAEHLAPTKSGMSGFIGREYVKGTNFKLTIHHIMGENIFVSTKTFNLLGQPIDENQ